MLSQPGIGFSAQVLQEFYSAAVTKQRLKMSHDDAMMKNMLGNCGEQLFAIRCQRPDRSDVQDHHGASETHRHALGRR